MFNIQNIVLLVNIDLLNRSIHLVVYHLVVFITCLRIIKSLEHVLLLLHHVLLVNNVVAHVLNVAIGFIYFLIIYFQLLQFYFLPFQIYKYSLIIFIRNVLIEFIFRFCLNILSLLHHIYQSITMFLKIPYFSLYDVIIEAWFENSGELDTF